MIPLKLISIILSFQFIGYIECYVLPQTFREFNPICIYSNIHKNKPYEFKLGYLFLSIKFPNNNFKETSLNQYNNFGTIVIKNGIVWWAYNNYTINPPYLKTNGDYYHKTIDINTNLIDFVLKFFNIYFDEFNEFYNKIYIKNKDNIKRVFIKNKYNTKRILFSYPYTFFISDNKKPTYMISLLPLNKNKTRIYITINNNNKYILNNFLFMIIKNYFEKINNNFLFNLKFKKYNSRIYLEKIYNFYSNYTIYNYIKY